MITEEQRGKLAFSKHQSIAENEEKRRELFIENILLLQDMKNGLYKDYLGDPDAKWAGYLAETEVYYTRSKVNKWMFIVERLVNTFAVPLFELLKVPESRLEEVARYANKDNYQSLLETAKAAIPQDWKDTILELRGKPTSLQCNHLNSDTLVVCHDCGHKHKANEPHTQGN